jgi:hypothetical protein
VPTYEQVAAYFPTWHDLVSGMVVNVVSQPALWLITLLLAWLVRDRRVQQVEARVRDPEQEERRDPVIAVLDALMFVSTILIVGPLVVALGAILATISFAVAIATVAGCTALLTWLIWLLWKAFTSGDDDV